MDPRLLDIVQLARQGERQQALLDLRAYLSTHPEDVHAWLALGSLAPDTKIQLSALRRAVQLEPDNEAAQRALALLIEKSTAKSAPHASETTPTQETTAIQDASAENIDAPNEKEPKTPVEKIPDLPEKTVDAEIDVTEEDEETPDKQIPDLPEKIEHQVSDDVREARACIWPFQPRNEKKRTLGALLDEGRVTRQDLIWAAAEAREEDVREVAQTLLDKAHRLPDVTMSLEDARLVSWPFRHLNRPLGELVDAETVRVKDLRRAAWFAKDTRVREAARLLLPLAEERRAAKKRHRKKEEAKSSPKPATKKESQSKRPKSTSSKKPANGAKKTTGQPTTRHAMPSRAKTRPMPIIQGSNYLVQEIQQRYRRQLRMTGIAVLLFLSGAIVTLYLLVTSFSHSIQPSVWVWPLLLVFVLPLFWLSERLMEVWDEERNFRKGQQGEIVTARQLRQGLGGDWVLFRNVQLPGNRVDIDMVLLGPPGLFAVEIKTYSGRYRYNKKTFYRYAPMMGWRKMHHNPGVQARAASTALHQYITHTLNENIWVEPRIAWVGTASLQLKEPDVYVWYLNNLDGETERLRTLKPKLSAEQRAALSGLLRGLCSTLR